MIKTLSTILKDNWKWRSQIGRLALFELVKKSRGAVLGWTWLFAKPAMYIFCFWFALDLGLRAGSGMEAAGQPPYFLWLCSGLIPWFFMQDILNRGSNVLSRYSYLVNKIKFPLSGISTIFTCATMIVQLALMVALFCIYFACGMAVDIYLLQVPLLLLLMFAFWNMVSIAFSQLSAMSKDFANLINAVSTPVFWLSGVIFNVSAISIDWIQALLRFNPVTFFASAFRDAFYDKTWFWSDPALFGSFAIVFVVTAVFMLFVYKRLSKEVPDAL